VNDEKGDFVGDLDIMLLSLRKLFSQLLKVHVVTDVRQTNTWARANAA